MWNGLVLIFNVILALPKIWEMIKTIQETVKKLEKEKEQKEYEETLRELKNAETPQQIERGFDDYFSTH